MTWIIDRIKEWFYERQWLKTKPCAACRYFTHFMASAGVCEARTGCPAERMKDCCDTCDCGRFKRK